MFSGKLKNDSAAECHRFYFLECDLETIRCSAAKIANKGQTRTNTERRVLNLQVPRKMLSVNLSLGKRNYFNCGRLPQWKASVIKNMLGESMINGHFIDSACCVFSSRRLANMRKLKSASSGIFKNFFCQNVRQERSWVIGLMRLSIIGNLIAQRHSRYDLSDCIIRILGQDWPLNSVRKHKQIKHFICRRRKFFRDI